MATSAMSVHERVAMLNLFTSSPETESPETSPCGVREPSVGAEAALSRRAASVRIARRSPWDCLAWEVNIRLKKAHMPARDSSHQPCFHFRFSRKAEALLATPARDARIEGTVVLSIVVGSDGSAHDINVVSTPDAGLGVKAAQAVQQWRFQPATKDGEVVAVNAQIAVNFKLM